MEIDQLKQTIPQTTVHPDLQQIAQEDDTIELGEIIAVIMDRKWLVAITTLLSLMIGVAVVFVSTPIYRADGLLQIEEKSTGMDKLEALQSLMGEDTTVSAEIEILSSRMIMSRVVERLKLDIVATPKTFPLIGSVIARRYVGDRPSPPWFGLSSYAWGGEVIQVDSLSVPSEHLDYPLLLVAGEANTFNVMDENGKQVLSGTIGTRASNEGFSIFVTQIKARSGTMFRLIKFSEETAIDNLRAHFGVKERGNKSGILELDFTGYDANKIGVVLDEIQKTYFRLNVERRSTQAQNTLRFLETQLPVLKEKVDTAEAAYNSYRQSRGSLDLSLETQGILKSLIDIEDATLKLKQEREKLRQRFTAEHPTIQTVDSQLARLDERRKQFDQEVAQLPDTQQTVVRLARDMEVSTKLYIELLNTAQQLKVSKAGTVGNVRIIDDALVARNPVGTKSITILSVALLLGLVASMLIILFQLALQVVVEDPESIEAKLGLPVYAVVPHSKAEAALIRNWQRGQKIGQKRGQKRRRKRGELLAEIKPDDDAVESLRSLRTTLHFALLDSARSSLLITGPSPSVGKSFLSKNLGVVLAQLGKRIVIIDADLRRGHIHKEFGLDREIGISEYITGQSTLSEIVKSTLVPNLFVITTGQISPNPSELLMHQRFEALLSELSGEFDTLIIDAPPVLAVSDAAIIGRHAGATMIIARAGKHHISELEQTVKRLNQAGVQVKGFILNDLNTDRQRKRYGYKGYVFNYSYK
jgi:tyrosine-protein kinase Etk/Wzc